MPQTLVSLDIDDKAWLDREARRRRMPTAELLRQVVRSYRTQQPLESQPTLEEALAQTAGIWQKGDALAWQQRMRDEWGQ